MPKPLSPHLQVYKLPIPALMSITHRLTGVFLSFGVLLLLWWIYALQSQDAALMLDSFIHHWTGKLVLTGIAFSGCYHWCNGIRHLIWDMGYCLEQSCVYKTGYIALFLSFIFGLFFCLEIWS